MRGPPSRSKRSPSTADGRGHPNMHFWWWYPLTLLLPGDWRANTICNNNEFSVLFSEICALGYARLGTWGRRISLLKVWQLIITLFNASFESLISNCLQEPIHGTLWKRHTKRADVLWFTLFSPFIPDNCTNIKAKNHPSENLIKKHVLC